MKSERGQERQKKSEMERESESHERERVRGLGMWERVVEIQREERLFVNRYKLKELRV